MASGYITNIYKAVYSAEFYSRPARQNMEQAQRPREPLVRRYISPELEVLSPRPTRQKLGLGFDTNGDHVPALWEIDQNGPPPPLPDWLKEHDEMHKTWNGNNHNDITDYGSPQTTIRHVQPPQYTAQREYHQMNRPVLPLPVVSDNRDRNFVYETTKRMLDRNNHAFLHPTRVGLAPPPGLHDPWNHAYQGVNENRATHNACIPEGLRTQPATQANYQPYANHNTGVQAHQQFSQPPAYQYGHPQANYAQNSLQAQPSSVYSYGYQYTQGQLYSTWAPQQQHHQAPPQYVTQSQYQQQNRHPQQHQQQSQHQNISIQGARHLRLPSPPQTHNTASRFVGRSISERREAYKINTTTAWEEQQERRLVGLPISVPKREWQSPIQAKQSGLAKKKFPGFACGIVFDEQMDDNLDDSELNLGEPLIPIKEGEDWRMKTESKHVEREWNGERVFWSREDYDRDGLVWYLGTKTFKEIEESERSHEELVQRARFEKWKRERDEWEEVACEESRNAYDEWRENDKKWWKEVKERERRQQGELEERKSAEEDAYYREQERQRIEREEDESRERDARRRQRSEEAIRKLNERQDERRQRSEATWREMERKFFDEQATKNVERRQRCEAAFRERERQYFVEQASKDMERRRRSEAAIREMERRHRDEEAMKEMERRQRSEAITRQAECLRWSEEVEMEAFERSTMAMSKKERKRPMSRRSKPVEKPESRNRKRAKPSKSVEKNRSKGRALDRECAHGGKTVICY